MPWHLEVRDGKVCVVKDGDSEPVPGGCHDSTTEARRHLDALYANEPQAAAASSIVIRRADTCGCGSPARTGCTCSTFDRTARSAAVATEPFADPFPVPEYAPAEWFARDDGQEWVDEWRLEHGAGPAAVTIDTPQGPTVLRRLTVTDDGRVGGVFWQEGVCLIDQTATMRPGQHECWTPSPSPTEYARFHQGDVAVEGGRLAAVGVVGNVGGHASPFVSNDAAAEHYANPDRQVFMCRSYDARDEEGRWYGYLAGAVVPATTFGDVAVMRRSALSGDWRWFHPDELNPEGGYDCLGPTLVTRPGLALVRAFRSSADDPHPVFLGGCGGVQLETDQLVQAGVPAADAITAAVSGSTTLPIADRGRTWDAAAAQRRLRGDTDTPSAQYRAAHFHVEGPADQFGSYSLPFADLIDGRLTAVPAGVFAAANAARGGRQEGSGSRFADARARIATYYRRMARQFDDDSIVPPWDRRGAANQEDRPMQVTLSDGIVLEVPDGHELAHEDGVLRVRVAAPPMPGSDNGGGEGGGVEARVARLEEAVAALGRKVEGMTKAAQASADKRLEDLDKVGAPTS